MPTGHHQPPLVVRFDAPNEALYRDAVAYLRSEGYRERHLKPWRLKVPGTFIQRRSILRLYWVESTQP